MRQVLCFALVALISLMTPSFAFAADQANGAQVFQPIALLATWVEEMLSMVSGH